jgi:4-carboxymuconolactone decarboxylase
MSAPKDQRVGDTERGVAPRMAELTKELLYGEIWERPGLSKRDRSLATVAALVATYRLEQIGMHIRRALDNGVTRDEIGELLTHLAFYVGWPACVSAARLAEQVFNET